MQGRGTSSSSSSCGSSVRAPDSAWRAACAASALKNRQKSSRRGATSCFASASAAGRRGVFSAAVRLNWP